MVAIYVRHGGRLLASYSVCEDCVGDVLDEVEAEHGHLVGLVVSVVLVDAAALP